MASKEEKKKKRLEGLKEFGKGQWDQIKSGGKVIGKLATLQAPDVKDVGDIIKNGWTWLKGLGKAIFNHPEWYTHYDTSNLVAMNLSNKQNVAYYQWADIKPIFENYETKSVGIPAVAQVMTRLTTPHGDLEGWRTGIRLLYQQLRTANAGRVNYSVQDLEKYVMNVRNLHAITAWLHRLYTYTYTFRSTNAQFPKNLLVASMVDPDDIVANAADLFMYIQRYEQQVRVSFPLNIDFYKRTRWLFSNTFMDSTNDKPSFYVYVFGPNTAEKALIRTGPKTGIVSDQIIYGEDQFSRPAFNGTIIFYTFNNQTGGWDQQNTWKPTGNRNERADGKYEYDTLYEYKDVVQNADYIKNKLIDDPMMAVIAGDIIKTYGDRAFMEPLETRIDEAMTAVYDESNLSQLQDANPIGCDIAKTTKSKVTASLPIGLTQTGYGVQYAENNPDNDNFKGWIDSELYSTYLGTTGNQDIDVYDDIAQLIVDRSNEYLYNWSKSEISPGEIMSISRLVPTDAYTEEVLYTGGTGNWSRVLTNTIGYRTFGTEVVTMVSAIFQSRNQNSGTASNVAKPAGPLDVLEPDLEFHPIGGNIFCVGYNDGEVDIGEAQLMVAQAVVAAGKTAAIWANFDWAPRYRVIGGPALLPMDNDPYESIVIPQSVAQDVLDWDTFAMVKAVGTATYLSYGNQSLLYAGASQNQANVDVYKHVSAKQDYVHGSKGKRAIMVADKK